MDGGGGLDEWPSRGRDLAAGRLLEGEWVARKQGSANGDLGDRTSGGDGLVGDPWRERANDDLFRR
jgi:hypothetical protein